MTADARAEVYIARALAKLAILTTKAAAEATRKALEAAQASQKR